MNNFPTTNTKPSSILDVWNNIIVNNLDVKNDVTLALLEPSLIIGVVHHIDFLQNGTYLIYVLPMGCSKVVTQIRRTTEFLATVDRSNYLQNLALKWHSVNSLGTWTLTFLPIRLPSSYRSMKKNFNLNLCVHFNIFFIICLIFVTRLRFVL